MCGLRNCQTHIVAFIFTGQAVCSYIMRLAAAQAGPMGAGVMHARPGGPAVAHSPPFGAGRGGVCYPPSVHTLDSSNLRRCRRRCQHRACATAGGSPPPPLAPAPMEDPMAAADSSPEPRSQQTAAEPRGRGSGGSQQQQPPRLLGRFSYKMVKAQPVSGQFEGEATSCWY